MSDSSSDEDYRKFNRKAKKSSVRTNVQDPESNRFAQEFAQKLLRERGCTQCVCQGKLTLQKKRWDSKNKLLQIQHKNVLEGIYQIYNDLYDKDV